MEALRTLVMVLPLSFTSGINLYATVLMVGLSVRLGWVEDAPANLAVLGAWPVIIVAGVLYVVEFLADKIQGLDHIWDTVHAFVRPLGAVVVAVIMTYGEADPVVTVLAVLVAGSVSLLSHGTKAGARVVMNVASPGENVTNVAVSVGEDVAAVGLVMLALKYPYVAAGVTAAIVVVLAVVGPRLLRWGWFMHKAGWMRVVAIFRQRRSPDGLPGSHLALVGPVAPYLVSHCKARGIRWVGGRSGYLSVADDRLVFTFGKWVLARRAWKVRLGQVGEARLRRGWLVDDLAVRYTDEGDVRRTAHFVFTRYRSPLAEAIGRRLEAQGLPDAPSGPAGVVSAPAPA